MAQPETVGSRRDDVGATGGSPFSAQTTIGCLRIPQLAVSDCSMGYMVVEVKQGQWWERTTLLPSRRTVIIPGNQLRQRSPP